MLLKVKNIKFLLLLLLPALALLGFKKGPGKGKIGTIKTVVIDAGHGGKDPGCNGAFAKEKDVSLSVALRLGKLIETHMKDVKVIYTRTTDVFVDLEERAQIANKAKADLFISIHCNAAGKVVKYKDPKTGKMKVKMRKNKKGKYVPVETTNPVPFGSETYVMGLKNEEGKMKVATRENSVIYLEDDYETKYGGFDPDSEESYIIMSNYTSAYVIQSANLALKIQDEYKNKAGRVDKGVHRQSIWVLWRTAMPSILTEIGYLTNPLEEGFLASEKGQDYISKAIFRGFRKYKDELEGTKRDYDDELEKQEPLENENIKAGNIPGQKAKDEDEETDNGEEQDKKDSVTTKTKTEIKSLPDQKDDNKGLIKEEIKPLPNEKDDNKGIVKEEKTVNDNKNNVQPLKDTLAIKTEENKLKNDAARYRWKLDSIEKAKSVKDKPEKEPTLMASTPVVFKVQFASSDVPLNLKDPKYSSVKNGSYYKANNMLKYTSGEFSSMVDATAHQNSLRQNGFKDCFVVAFKNGERIDINEAKKLAEKQQ